MNLPKARISPVPVTVLAGAALLWGALAVGFAALGPPGAVPRPFHSLHFEHFIAFYALGVLCAAALPMAPLGWTAGALIALATVFGLIRGFVIEHTQGAALYDWACDVAGVLAAIAPVLVGMHRQAFRAWSRQNGTNDPS